MTMVEPIHDREDFGTEVEIGWSNFLGAADLPAPSRPTATSFRITCDIFHFKTVAADVQQIELDENRHSPENNGAGRPFPKTPHALAWPGSAFRQLIEDALNIRIPEFCLYIQL
jgi:hypothetical protein